MSWITRYILRQTLATMVFVAVCFTAAVWLLQSLRLIDLIVNRGLSAGLFAYLAILILPRFVDVVLPIAVFIAVLFTYNRLLIESELVVMRAAGMSQADLARPALITGAVGMAMLLSMSVYFLPAANRAFKDLQFEIRNRFASVLLQDGIFNTLSDTLTIYVRSRDANGELVGLLVHETRDPSKPVTIIADRARFRRHPRRLPADRRVQSPRADPARAAGDPARARLRGPGYRPQEPGRAHLDRPAVPLSERDGADLGDDVAAVAR